MIGVWVYRHIIQVVCPWNLKFAEPSAEPAYRACPDTDGPAPMALMGLSDDEFQARFSGSPVKRAKRRGLLRNVAVALGNWGSDEAISILARSLKDTEPLIRGHSAWALGRILHRDGIPEDRASEVKRALHDRRALEADPWVREELEAALGGVEGADPTSSDDLQNP
jgi:epoxyqueuosine reductase